MAISTNGTVLARVAGALYNTQMSNATYSEVKTLDPASLVDALYARDFSSATDLTVATTLVSNLGLSSVTGLNSWVAAQLTAAGSHKGAKIVDLLNSFAQMTADATYGAAATAFNTKVDAALVLSQTTGNAGGTFAEVGTAPVAGATFTLTSAAETKNGTAGADTFLALNSGDLGNSDIIDGAAGNDTLFAVVSTTASSATLLRPTLASVETVQFEMTDGSSTATTSTFNFDKSSGVKTVNIKANALNTNADTFAVTGVTTATSLKISDDAGATTGRTNNYTVSYDGVTGTADVASAEVSSTVSETTLGNITVAGVETLTVASTGGAKANYGVVAANATTVNVNASAASGGSVNVQGAAMTTLNVNAADSVTITDATTAAAKLRTVNIDSQTAAKTVTLTDLSYTVDSAAVDALSYTVKGAGKATLTFEDLDFGTQSTTNADSITVNASANTGGVAVNVAAITNAHAARAISVTGGTGNDTVTVIKTALDKYDTIALGDGTADRLSVAVTANTNADVFYTDTTATADLPVISGVEIASVAIGTSSSSATLDVTSAKFASTVELTGTQHGTDTLAVSGIAADQKVALGSSTAQFVNGAATTLNVTDASTNTADVLNITTDIVNSTATGTLAGITAANVETVSVDLASTTAANTTIAAGTLTFANATSVALTGSKITSATVIAKTGATIDASGVTGALTLTANDAKNYTLKGSATAATSFVLGSELNATDSVTGGAATTDSLTATVTGLTATTGKLAVTGVEALNLTNTGTAVVDATGIVGATNVVLIGAGTSTSLTKLATGAKVTLGNGAGDVTFTGALTVSLADATGSSDSLTLDLNGGGTRGTTTLTTTGIETLILNGNTSTTANVAYEAQTVNTGASTASTINVTGGHATPAKITLSTLNAATTLVDASAFTGGVVATAATNTATTFKVRASTSNDITGSVLSDTVIVGSATNQAAGDIGDTGEIDGDVGTDTLTVYAKDGGDLSLANNFEIVNVIVDAAANATIDLGGSGQGADDAASVTITGGAAGKTLALSGIASDLSGGRTIDASGVASTTTLTLGDNVLVQTNASDPLVVKGGTSAADVLAYTASNDNSGEVTISGFETIQVTNGDSASTLNLKNVTGANTIEAVGAGQLTISNIGNSQKVVLGTYVGSTATVFSDGTGDSVSVSRATDGTADVLSVDLNTTSTFTLTDNQVETVNLALVDTAGDDDHVLTLSSTSATTVNVTGTGTAEDLTLTAAGALLTSVNATALVGNFTYDVSNRAAQAMTISSGTGNDTIGMTYAADVLDGGTKASDNDTLNVSFTGTGGALIVDLSSSTDQVQMFNGLANAAVQKNFESVSAAAYTQTNSIGADITGSDAANTITGSAYADTIRAGKGADTIVVATDGAGNSDFIDGGADGDTLQLAVGTNNTFATDANLVNVETITLGNGTNTLTLTGQTEAFTINGGTGADTIVGGSGIDTIVAGIGADNITGAAGADVITLSTETSAAVDTVIYNATTEGGDTITGFISGSDKIKLLESAFGTTAAWSSHALIGGATSADATSTYFELTTGPTSSAVDLNAAGTTTKAIVVVGASSGTAGVSIYYTTGIGAFATGNSILIATLTGLNTGDIAITDFLGY